MEITLSHDWSIVVWTLADVIVVIFVIMWCRGLYRAFTEYGKKDDDKNKIKD